MTDRLKEIDMRDGGKMKRRDALIAIGAVVGAMSGKFAPTWVIGEEKKKEEEEIKYDNHIDESLFVLGPYDVTLIEKELNNLELHYADGAVTRISFKEIFSALKEIKRNDRLGDGRM